jgi:glycogen operon protein
MGSDDWHDGSQAVVVWLNGVLGETDERGEPLVGNSALLVVNAGDVELAVRLPDDGWGSGWTVRLDTSAGAPTGDPAGVARHDAAAVIPVQACSLLVLIADDAVTR